MLDEVELLVAGRDREVIPLRCLSGTRRGEIWYASFYDHRGKRIIKSTGCTDRKAADTVRRQYERDAADPAIAASKGATLRQAVEAFVGHLVPEVERGKRSEATLRYYRCKVAAILSGFREDRLLSDLEDPNAIDDYISVRRQDEVSDTTIKKELTALGPVLRLAKRRGWFLGDLDRIMPKFAGGYEPGKRAFTRDQFVRLLAETPANRAALLSYVVATTAEPAAIDRALRVDVTGDTSTWEGVICKVHGSKNEYRKDREVPIETPEQKLLLRFALEHADGEGDKLFTPWTNSRRDIHLACSKAGVEPASLTDFRRTAATWLRESGIALDLIAKSMGHRDSTMVERVYGKIKVKEHAVLMREQLALHAGLSVAVRDEPPLALPEPKPRRGRGRSKVRRSINGASTRSQDVTPMTPMTGDGSSISPENLRANWVPSMNVRSALLIDLGRERRQRKSKRLEPPLVSRLLAKAERWQAEIDRGEVRNLTALARREGLSHVYVGHLLRLLRLHPDIKAAIAALPAGTPSRAISERSLRSVTKLPPEQQLAELWWLVTRTA